MERCVLGLPSKGRCQLKWLRYPPSLAPFIKYRVCSNKRIAYENLRMKGSPYLCEENRTNAGRGCLRTSVEKLGGIGVFCPFVFKIPRASNINVRINADDSGRGLIISNQMNLQPPKFAVT